MLFEIVKSTLEPFSGKSVFVGFSGGADSAAALLATQQTAGPLKLQLAAVHFEHGIRGEESCRDAEWCEQFCREKNIQFLLFPLNVPANRQPGENLEAAARRLRLEKWHELTRKNPDCAIILGHHANDRMENLFIRLCRGANATGLTSLRQVRALDGMTFIRPLLDIPRTKIEEYLQHQGVTNWRIDSTNADNDLTRNFFRNRIIPEIVEKLPTAASGLNRAAKALEDDADFLEQTALAQYEKISGAEYTPVDFWQKSHPALLPRLLRLWLTERTGQETIPDHDLIARFENELNAAGTEKILIPVNADLFIAIQAKDCLIIRQSSETIPPEQWNWREQPTIHFMNKTISAEVLPAVPENLACSPGNACFNAKELPETLLLTGRMNGDKIIPFGSNHPVKLKKIITDRKLSASEQNNIVVIRTSANDILWVPGVRHSALAAIQKNSTTIVRLSVIN